MKSGKHIELSMGQEPGEFRLVMDGIAVIINLNTLIEEWAAGEATRGPTAVLPAPAPEAAPGLSLEDPQATAQLSVELDHYRQVFQDIYEGLGKLAKDINLSIQDPSLAEIIKNAMSSPGEPLDQARNQVTDVLEMTEQATLNIMDLVEQIREDCQAVQAKLLNLAESHSGEELGDLPEAVPEEAADQGLWDQILSQAEDLDGLLRPADPEEGSPAAGVPSFSLADILQVLLEFCTNEKVKQHLKAVQAKQDVVIRRTEAERALSLLAAGVPQEDGFYQLPVEPVLELLQGHCEDERIKELLTKMSSSAEKLFPVAALPLEAQDVEEEFADELSETQGDPEVVSRWQDLQKTLKLLAEHRQAAGNGVPGAPGNNQVAAEVQEVLGTVDRITGSLSRIIEALSFQDLSGQRLLKILNIIQQLQVQVLTLLVAAGHKLQEKLDDLSLPLKKSDQAREELDRLLNSFVPTSDQDVAASPEEQPLDQNAINDLLIGMGF
jgi:chemotaxis regulatin CheY-phosphate phosphatase CheZ